MIISEKQHEANRQNAQHSSGPVTPEGKAAVRLNAVTYGLRARELILPWEDPEEYKQLWAALEAQWQPQNRTERMYLEQMATSQWLLARIARRETRIYEQRSSPERELPLLDRVSILRARQERSFTIAMHELKQLQKERQATPPQPVAARPTTRATPPPVRPPDYVMSEDTEDHPVFSAPATPDSR